MKKHYKDSWIKALFAVVFVFGIGATYLIFSNEPMQIIEKPANERLEIMGSNYESVAQENILDSLNNLKLAYESAIFEKTALSQELELQKLNIENLMEIIKASKNPSVQQIKIYRKQLSDLQTALNEKVIEVKKLKSQNKNLLTEIETQNVVMYKQKAENDTLISKQIALREKSSGKELETEKAKNTKKLKISFSVNGNAVAKTGKRVYYVQVLDQKNTVLGENKLIEFENDKALVYSFLIALDFQGKTSNVYGILNADESQFKKGTYFVNFFDKQEIMGSTSITLE
jgi:hypothetical protein